MGVGGRGSASSRGVGRPISDTTGYSQRAGGTHSTELLSCLILITARNEVGARLCFYRCV